jgi:hypothetical protein
MAPARWRDRDERADRGEEVVRWRRARQTGLDEECGAEEAERRRMQGMGRDAVRDRRRRGRVV